MKKVIVVLLFSFLVNSLYSQNATLTKGETIAYLEKKFKEVEGTIVGYSSYLNYNLRFDEGKIILRHTTKYSGPGPSTTTEEYKFNPIYINGFEIYSLNSPDFLVLKIKLSVPAHYSQGQYQSNRNYVDFHFVGNRNDDSNGQKIKKALLHLQALLKAEDDPFQ